MIYDSLEWPWLAASNGGKIMLLGSIDKEIFPKVSKLKNNNNSSSTEARAMKIPPFDALHYDESNKV